MILLFLVGFVVTRSLIGWDVNVSKNGSYVPRGRTRIIALACLPVLVTGTEAGQSPGVGSILYLLSFGILGVLLSKRRAAA